MDGTPYIDRIVERLNSTFRLLAMGRNMVYHSGGIEWFMTVPRGGIERVFHLALTEENARQQVEELVEQIRGNQAPNAVILTPLSTPPGIGGILLANGFTLLDESQWGYGMAMELQDWSWKQPIPDKITVRRVEGPEMFEQWVEIVNTALFGKELMKSTDFPHLTQQEALRLYLVYWEGRSVGTCLSFSNQDTADINYVATLREYRKRGVATAAIVTALSQVRQAGTRVATLSGEAAAMPLYEQLGFKKYFAIPVYEFRG